MREQKVLWQGQQRERARASLHEYLTERFPRQGFAVECKNCKAPVKPEWPRSVFRKHIHICTYTPTFRPDTSYHSPSPQDDCVTMVKCVCLSRCPGCKHPIKKAEDQAAAASSETETPAVADGAPPAPAAAQAVSGDE